VSRPPSSRRRWPYLLLCEHPQLPSLRTMYVTSLPDHDEIRFFLDPSSERVTGGAGGRSIWPVQKWMALQFGT
jgi:hypothetical protein